jgi:hypothetical protein
MWKKLYRNNRVKTGTRQVFGDDEEYRVEEDDGTYIYTRRSQGDREMLWNYYQDDMDLMQDWNPSQSEEYREFGYAYSELLVKNHIVNTGENIRELYSDISPGRKSESGEEKWSYLSQQMEMEPCNYDSRERFDDCLDEVNSHEYPVYSASSIQRGSSTLRFDEIDVPNRTEAQEKRAESRSGEEVSFLDFLQGFFRYLRSLLS